MYLVYYTRHDHSNGWKKVYNKETAYKYIEDHKNEIEDYEITVAQFTYEAMEADLHIALSDLRAVRNLATNVYETNMERIKQRGDNKL